MVLVYVLDVEKESKDAQIIGSRAQIGFVEKLIEREIEDVADGVVNIVKIAREPGAKTKVAVSSTLQEVDPVGAIIGVKGTKIQPIIEELSGERIDIIKYHDDLGKFIAEAVLPAKIKGVKIKIDEEGQKFVTVVVDKDEFLPTIGKKGINVKLAAILTGTKLDVKTVEEAEAEGIEWDVVVEEKRQTASSHIQSVNEMETEGVSIDDINDAAVEEEEFDNKDNNLNSLYGLDDIEDENEQEYDEDDQEEEYFDEEEYDNY